MTNIDRRSLAKGAAWAAPVLMVAAAAPSVAASSPPLTRVTGWADKCPGASDVPGGWPKHGYRVVLAITPEPTAVVPVEVTLGNGKLALVLTHPTRTADGWEFVVDAGSSPSTLTITVDIDNTTHTFAVKAHPHCTGGAA